MQNYSVDKERLCSDIGTLKGKKVLILGDIMLDVYLQGQAKRISPEAPVPVVHVHSQKHLPGGAANVARNIHSLGGLPTLIGLCGSDPDGQSLVRLLEKKALTSYILQSSERQTIVKTRVLAQGQQVLRFDKEENTQLSEQEQNHIYACLEKLLPEHEVLIISDYAKGLLQPSVTEHIHAIAKRMPHAPQILVDPKPQNMACYSNMSLMTPNKSEAAQMVHKDIEEKESIIEAGRQIMQGLACKELLITLGAQGMAVFTNDGKIWNIPTASKAVFDVTGAGDTVIATLALACAAHLDTVTASLLANYAAGLVLEHVGVACITAEELVAGIEKSNATQFYDWT